MCLANFACLYDNAHQMPLLFLIAYFIGSVPFGLILARLGGYGDIRDIGSGNIGATNVARTGNKWLAGATVLLDGAKGALAVILIIIIPIFDAPPSSLILVGIFAVLGHCFPVWLKFKGGKGFATFLGVLLAAAPIAGLISIAAWLVGVAITRISSVGALSSIAVAPIACGFLYGLPSAITCAILSAVIAARHYENIKRLIAGCEIPIGNK